jgi:thioredoxin-like negative regulator of GroEL
MNKLIYVSAAWCGPCKTFGPIMSKVAESGVPVQKMDADTDSSAVMKYGVRNVPTVLKVDAGGNMIDKFVGVKSIQQVIDFYNG